MTTTAAIHLVDHSSTAKINEGEDEEARRKVKKTQVYADKAVIQEGVTAGMTVAGGGRSTRSKSRSGR